MDERLASELEFKLHQLEEFSSTLLFHRVRPEHRGTYTCLAKNGVAQDAYSQLMTIYGRQNHIFVLIKSKLGQSLINDLLFNNLN